MVVGDPAWFLGVREESLRDTARSGGGTIPTGCLIQRSHACTRSETVSTNVHPVETASTGRAGKPTEVLCRLGHVVVATPIPGGRC